MRKTWKYTRRKINGKMRDVKVITKSDGKPLVRIVGVRNTTDGYHQRGNYKKR